MRGTRLAPYDFPAIAIVITVLYRHARLRQESTPKPDGGTRTRNAEEVHSRASILGPNRRP